MKGLLQLLAFLIIVALLAVDIYVRVSPPQRASVPPPTPRPTASASPTPTPEEAPTATTPAPTPTTAATTEVVVAPPAADGKQAAAAPAVDPAAAAKPPTLRKPKATAKPAAPTAAPGAPSAASGPSFVTSETMFTAGETKVEGKAGSAPEVPLGFDPGGVAVKVPPKVAATIEFDVQPKRLKAGDPYTVKVYLRNQGKKDIKVRELRVGSVLNGVRSESAVTPKSKEVPAQLVGLLVEVPSVWKGDVKTWTLEVTVKSGHGEVYTSSVSWR